MATDAGVRAASSNLGNEVGIGEQLILVNDPAVVDDVAAHLRDRDREHGRDVEVPAGGLGGVGLLKVIAP